jgi:hypothetical protein
MAKKKAVAKKTTAKKKPAMKKTTAKKKPAAKAARGEMLIVASKTREILKNAGCNVAGDALEGLNGWMYWLLQQASVRAKMNGRKTVRAHDFLAM